MLELKLPEHELNPQADPSRLSQTVSSEIRGLEAVMPGEECLALDLPWKDDREEWEARKRHLCG
jgi:hypothetical protein